MLIRIQIHKPTASRAGFVDFLCPPGITPRDIDDGLMMFGEMDDEGSIQDALAEGTIQQTEGMRLFSSYLTEDEEPAAIAEVEVWLHYHGHEVEYVHAVQPSSGRKSYIDADRHGGVIVMPDGTLKIPEDEQE